MCEVTVLIFLVVQTMKNGDNKRAPSVMRSEGDLLVITFHVPVEQAHSHRSRCCFVNTQMLPLLLTHIWIFMSLSGSIQHHICSFLNSPVKVPNNKVLFDSRSKRKLRSLYISFWFNNVFFLSTRKRVFLLFTPPKNVWPGVYYTDCLKFITKKCFPILLLKGMVSV